MTNTATSPDRNRIPYISRKKKGQIGFGKPNTQIRYDIINFTHLQIKQENPAFKHEKVFRKRSVQIKRMQRKRKNKHKGKFPNVGTNFVVVGCLRFSSTGSFFNSPMFSILRSLA